MTSPVNLAYAPIWRFADNNNFPLVGGLLYTYFAGTTSPATTWVDSLGVTPNTNPIVLNARGETATTTGTSVGVWLLIGTAYKFVLNDSAGNLIWTFDNYTIATGSGGGGGGGGGGIPQTLAELTASVTPTNTLYAPGNVYRYGATLASSDNTAAFQQALNAAQYGQEVYIPSGLWNIASTAGLSSLTLFSNTVVRGDGSNLSKIQVTGTNVGHLFYGTNLVHIVFKDIWLAGNSQATTSGQGGAIYFNSDNTIVATIGGYEISHCRFDNFKGVYWLSFFLFSNSQEMRRIRIQDCDFISQPGNAISGSNIGIGAWCIAIQGSNSGQVYCSDIDISNCTCEAQYIKGLLVLWGGVIRAKIHHNIVKNAGTDAFFSDDDACYAFISYRQAGTYGNDRIEFDHNIVDGCRDCGFYIVSTLNVNVTDNDIRNQTSAINTTLPKGAIVTSGVLNALIANNRIDNCRFGISWFGIPPVSTGVIDANQITNLPSSAPGILIGTNGASVWDAITFYSVGNYVSSAGSNYYCIQANLNAIPASNPSDWQLVTQAQWKSLLVSNNQLSGVKSGCLGIDLVCSATTGGHSLKITGNDIDCFRYAIFLDQGVTGDALFDIIDVSNNLIKSGNSGGLYLGSTLHPNISVRSNQFDKGTSFNNAVWMFQVVASTKIDLSNNEFSNFTNGTGACINGANVLVSTMRGNVFQNCGQANLSDANATYNFGLTLPNWGGATPSDFVQFLLPIEAGSAASKYTKQGWQWDNTAAAWKEVRALTGN